MPTRVAVFSQPRSGTHFITRSLAGSARVPYSVSVCYGARYDIPVDVPGWVIASHDPYTEEVAERLAEAGAAIIGITRNPLDHLLSLLGHRDDVTDGDLIAAAQDGWVQDIRRFMFAVPEERRVSYDLLADAAAAGHEDERRRLASIAGLDDVALEGVDVTRAALGSVQVPYARPGRWKSVIPVETAKQITRHLGESYPE